MKKRLTFFSIMFLLIIFSVVAVPFQEQLLTEINLFRAENGLGALVVDDTLTHIAIEYSFNMMILKTFSHNVLSIAEWQEMAAHYNVRRECDELLVYAPEVPPDIHKTFLCLINSPEHRAGILRIDGIAFGAGYIEGKTCTYITAYVGGPIIIGDRN